MLESRVALNVPNFKNKKFGWNKNESKWGYKCKTTMLRSSLCDYTEAYILVKGTITMTRAGDDASARRSDERNKVVIFKNCAPFIKCISRINDAEIDNAQDIDILMPMYNLIEYSNIYSKTSGSLWQYYKDDPNDNLVNSE